MAKICYSEPGWFEKKKKIIQLIVRSASILSDVKITLLCLYFVSHWIFKRAFFLNSRKVLSGLGLEMHNKQNLAMIEKRKRARKDDRERERKEEKTDP